MLELANEKSEAYFLKNFLGAGEVFEDIFLAISALHKDRFGEYQVFAKKITLKMLNSIKNIEKNHSILCHQTFINK